MTAKESDNPVMGAVSALRSMLRDVTRVDAKQITYVTALRNAVGVVTPLAVGAATGHLLPSLTVATGALNVAFSDRPGPYRLRAGRMLLAGACSGLSGYVGSATGSIAWLAVPLVACGASAARCWWPLAQPPRRLA